MSRSKHTEAQMIAAVKQMEAGRKAEDVAREVGVSTHTIYAWKSKYGGMDVSEAQEAKRLRAVMDELDGVNLFISEGAGVSEIVAAMEDAGEEVPRDPFGHVQLDKINPGHWFAKQFAAALGAAQVLVQKSG